jgi:hypothetical protein
MFGEWSTDRRFPDSGSNPLLRAAAMHHNGGPRGTEWTPSRTWLIEMASEMKPDTSAGAWLIDSHCHIDTPEYATKPINRHDSAGSSVWFDAGWAVRWV